MSEWYDDRRNLAAVARHMGERGDSVDDVAYMLEKPEKFADEWRASDATSPRGFGLLRTASDALDPLITGGLDESIECVNPDEVSDQ